MHRMAAGFFSGLIAGLVMAIAMMGYLAWQGQSIWTNANLIAAIWIGESAAAAGLSSATLIGLATHFMASALMGVLAVPFVFALPKWRTLLLSVAFALASYPFAFATIMVWADPVMFGRSEFLPMTAAYALFGIAFGISYILLAGERQS